MKELFRAIATMNVYFRSENSSAVARDRVEQILATGQATTISDFVKLIDSVTSADVNKVNFFRMNFDFLII